MCFCHKHSCLEKTNKVVRNFLSLEQDFLISCYGAAMLAMLVDATSSCPKQWTLHIHDHVWADKSKRSLAQISTCKSKEYGQVVKSIGTVCAKLVETNSSACAMFVVSASNYIYFSLHRACQAEKMMKSRDFKLLLKKRLKPRLFLQPKKCKTNKMPKL